MDRRARLERSPQAHPQLRRVPDGGGHRRCSPWCGCSCCAMCPMVAGPGMFGPTRSDLLDAFVPKAALMLAFLLVFSAPGRVDPRRQHARSPDADHQCHPPGRGRVALPPDPAGGPQGRVPRARGRLRHHARAARGPGRRAAEIRRQRLPRAAHPAGDHADAARRRPQRSGRRHPRARRAPPLRQHPGDRPHRGTAPAQPRRPAGLHPRARRPVAPGGRGHRDAHPARGGARRHHRDLRRDSAPPPARTRCCSR